MTNAEVAVVMFAFGGEVFAAAAVVAAASSACLRHSTFDAGVPATTTLTPFDPEAHP